MEAAFKWEVVSKLVFIIIGKPVKVVKVEIFTIQVIRFIIAFASIPAEYLRINRLVFNCFYFI